MSLYVLDSWAVLEWIKRREPAAGSFHDLIVRTAYQGDSLAMSRINHGEVIYTIRKAPDIHNRAAALAALSSLSMTLHSVDDALVDAAVEIKSTYSVAYADAFAAALAARLNAVLVTGDREFRALEADGVLKLYWLGA